MVVNNSSGDINMNQIPSIKNVHEPHMAVLFLIDISGAMTGKPINEVINAMNRFREEIIKNKELKDVLDVAVVEFNSTVRVVQEFVPVEFMEPVSFLTYGSSNRKLGLQMAINMIGERRRFYRHAGTEPYCPYLILITDDGCSDESIDDITNRLHQYDKEQKLKLWILLTKGSDLKRIKDKKITERVLSLESINISKMFDWIICGMPVGCSTGLPIPDNQGELDDWIVED